MFIKKVGVIEHIIVPVYTLCTVVLVWEVYNIYKLKSVAIGQKFKKTDNAHKRTLQAHGDRNNWTQLNGKEAVFPHVY